MDIELTAQNIDTVTANLLQGVSTISNHKRATKRSEVYLQCGGGYDTESTTITDADNKPLFAFVYHIQICINGQYIYFRDIALLQPFFISLCNVIKKMRTAKKQPKLIIWVANLAHEYAFFKRQLAYVGISDIFAKTARQPIKIVLQDCIEFRECLGLFGSSLKKVAELYTHTQKLSGDLDYTLIRTPATPLTEREKAYCKNDVVILDELSRVAFEKFTLQGLKIPMTGTGILRQKCKRAIPNIRAEYKANEKLMPETEYDYYLMRKYMYAGGLSGTNPMYAGIKINKAKCADVTSDYPAQMNQQLFPSGQLRECKPAEIGRYKRQFRIFLFTADFKSKTAHAVLSKHKILNFYNNKDCPYTTAARDCIINNGKIQYGKNICCCLNNIDIAALSELYDITNITLYRTWYFTSKSRAPKWLLQCMNDDYLTKQQLKAAGLSHTKEYMEAKINVNSYYGMTATRLYDCLFCYNETIEDIDDMPSELSYAQKRCKMWLSPYIGYWTTSYARALLMHYIARYPELILQYDTDSLYYITDDAVVPAERIAAFESELRNHNRRIALKNRDLFNNNEHFSDLGAWDIDSTDYIGFKGVGAKRYLKQTADGALHPVVAGMVKASYDTYISDTGADAFDVFNSDLTLDRITSEKLASVYYDGVCKEIYINGKKKRVPDWTAPQPAEKITDYMGNITIVSIGTYHALFAVEFTMKGAATYLQYAQMLQQEKALPAQYRQLESIMENWR